MKKHFIFLSLYDKEGNVIETVISDANGKYKFTERHIAELSYIKIEKEGYLTSEISLNPEKLTNKNAKLDLTPIAVALNVSRGISSARLSYKGYGESELINRCTNGVKCSEEEHQLNRRSTFTIRN